VKVKENRKKVLGRWVNIKINRGEMRSNKKNASNEIIENK
jgi:hypothetical protein